MKQFYSLLLILSSIITIYSTINLLPQIKDFSYYKELLTSEIPKENTLLNPIQDAVLIDTWQFEKYHNRVHQGIDIFAPVHSNVRSSSDGIVIGLEENTYGTKSVLILGYGGLKHFYAHLNEYKIQLNQKIKKGDIIGYLGTNSITNPHLHYSIQSYKGAINPYPLLENTDKLKTNNLD